jgi:hypothetical protein
MYSFQLGGCRYCQSVHIGQIAHINRSIPHSGRRENADHAYCASGMACPSIHAIFFENLYAKNALIIQGES